MASLERLTPKSVFDLYLSLNEKEKSDFLTLLASVSSGKVPLFIHDKMSKAAQIEFNERRYTSFFNLMMPILIEQACELLLKHPEIVKEELIAKVSAQVDTFLKKLVEESAEQEREMFKNKRDRKSNPETIRRNVGICNLRHSDPKKWTQGKLAKKFHITPQAIRKILGAESEWRAKASQLSTN